MKVFDDNGRELEAEVEHGSDPVDAYIGRAYYVDTGVEASVELCEWLTEAYAGEIQESFSDYQIGRAEHYCDIASDR